MKVFLIIFTLSVSNPSATTAIGPIQSGAVCEEYAQQVIHGPGSLFAVCAWINIEQK
jgi:hypothetical protein